MWRWMLRRLGFQQTLERPLVFPVEPFQVAPAIFIPLSRPNGDSTSEELFRRALLVLHRLHAAEWRRFEAQTLYLTRTSVLTPAEAEARGLPAWFHEADAILREAGWEVET